MTEFKVTIGDKVFEFETGKAPPEVLYHPHYVRSLEHEYLLLSDTFKTTLKHKINEKQKHLERDLWVQQMGELLMLDFTIMDDWKNNLGQINVRLNELRNAIGLPNVEIVN